MPSSQLGEDTLTPNALSLAGVLCARLCHDLAGNLGALGGMLDLVAEAAPGPPDPEAVALARACTRDMTNRLRLLRAAWAPDMDSPNLVSLVAGLPGAERLTVDLAGLANDLEEPVRQLAASLLMVAAGGLPKGGTIRLSGDGGHLDVWIDGTRAGWPAALAACLAGPAGVAATAAEPRWVGLAIATLQAQALDLTLRITSPCHLEARQDGR